jgi:hypothetical protein
MTLDENKKLIRRVKKHLIKNDMHSSLKKCSLYVTEVKFLGHGVNRDEKKIKQVK